MERVTDNKAEAEFELIVSGQRAVAAYQLEGDTIVFTHTIVPKAIEGRAEGHFAMSVRDGLYRETPGISCAAGVGW
jgi:hypothetical protein